MSDGDGDGDAEPLRLRGAQREIRDAYFASDAGLFTLDCVPGAGKSVVAHHVAAEDILRRYAAGDPTPEQHVAVVSFNRDEAAEIVPAICDRLRAIVEHDLVPAAADVTEAELRYLQQRTRQAPYAGTIDAFLRGVFREFAGDIGFDETPSIGNDALLKRVHRDCRESLRDDPEHARRLRDLEAAYPDGEYDAGVDEMLADALRYCRDRRLSVEAFRSELGRTRDSVYPDGRPDSFDDIVRSVERFVEGEAIADAEPAGGAGDRVREAVTGSDRARLLDADRELYDAWDARIDDFCAVLSAYRTRYRAAVRERGVVSHTDVAYLVDAYFDGPEGRSDLPEALRSVDHSHRDRVRRTYRSRIRSLVIDEAQDVSAVQHAALSHVVTGESRVFACGDVLQGIYLWRHADPRWFAAATTEGRYLGVDWDIHENRTATTTYRCVPDVAAAINAVAEPVFDDPARGDLGGLDASFPRLEAARGGGGGEGGEDGEGSESDDSPAVHVSSFAGVGRPGSATWANPDGEAGEANVLATLVSRGLADGTFRDADGDPLGVTVLFRRGTRMPEYEAAFADEGLRVRTATDALFDCPAVETVFAVCEWLVAPGSPERTVTLLTNSPLCVLFDPAPFEARSWDLGRVLEDDPAALSAAQRGVLRGLVSLRDRSDAFGRLPASASVEDVIEALALRSDPTGCVEGTDPAQRVANLDALVETVSEWEGEGRRSLSGLLDIAEPFREDPGAGPTQPSAAGAAYDVEFRTVHRAKGDQDDVVVVADPGFDVWSRGPHTRRFVAQGEIAGLAPPTNTEVPGDLAVPPFDGGLYGVGDGWGRDAGLRWATARWRDSASGSALGAPDPDTLVGPDRLRRVAENERAEAWRLLYVALTRARDHLVVPLPRSDLDPDPDRARDRWLDTLRDGLAFPRDGTDSYELRLGGDPNRDAIEVGVNDVDLFAGRDAPTPRTGRDHVAAFAPERDRLDPWVPRFLSPSTMYPLTEDVERYALAHLLGEPLHTTTNEVSDDLPLRFDRLGPEAVGTCLHDAITELVVRGVDEPAVRAAGPEVRAAFDQAVNALSNPVGEAEREGMFAFLETVLDDFLASDLWERIADPATAVGVERPLDGLAEVGGLEVEIHGRADFVVEYPTGERFVTDVKVALAEPTPETRRRYELQIAAYAFLAEQSGSPGTPVRRTVETFGVATETTGASWPTDIVHRRLRRLLDR